MLSYLDLWPRRDITECSAVLLGFWCYRTTKHLLALLKTGTVRRGCSLPSNAGDGRVKHAVCEAPQDRISNTWLQKTHFSNIKYQLSVTWNYKTDKGSPKLLYFVGNKFKPGNTKFSAAIVQTCSLLKEINLYQSSKEEKNSCWIFKTGFWTGTAPFLVSSDFQAYLPLPGKYLEKQCAFHTLEDV